MAYTDLNYKLDWAMSFQRTGKFPLDRSSMFASYEDALAYAKQDGSDSRTIGGTSYVGQIIAVFSDTEVSAYIITEVGENAALSKLGSAAATEDVETALTELINEVSARVTTLEGTVGDETAGLVKDVADNASNITGLDTRLTTAEGDIDNLETRATSLETRATNAEGRLDTAESDIDELQNTVNNLTGAFVYRGISTTDPTSESGPTVADYTEAWKTGDVVVYGVEETYTDADGDPHTVTTNKEYVYNGSTWREIGDEGSHLTKSEAAATYVEQTHTINGHDLSGGSTVITGSDIAVSDADTATTLAGKISAIETSIAETNTAIDEAIGALDVAAIAVGQGNTIESISETDGKISVSVTGIVITHDQVSDWETEVTGQIDTKIGALDASVTGLAANKTITSLSETDGVISATASDISITHDQVSDFTTTVDGQIDAKIAELDFAEVSVSANETVSAISETDGKISVTKQSITGVPQASVVGLPDALAARINYDDLSSEFSVDETTKAVSVNEISAAKIKVAESDGTSVDLDSKIDAIEAALADVDAVDIDVVKVNGTALEIVDKAVDIPLATASQAGVVLSATGANQISVGSDGVMTLSSIDGSAIAVSNIDAGSIVQNDSDVLIIDGGDATGASSVTE